MGRRRIPPAVLEEDRAALFAILELEDYESSNPELSKENLIAAEASLTRAQRAEARSEQIFHADRDRAIDESDSFHNLMIGAKAQVVAKYGRNSSAVSAVGLKKQTERKRPSRRAEKALA